MSSLFKYLCYPNNSINSSNYTKNSKNKSKKDEISQPVLNPSAGPSRRVSTNKVPKIPKSVLPSDERSSILQASHNSVHNLSNHFASHSPNHSHTNHTYSTSLLNSTNNTG